MKSAEQVTRPFKYTSHSSRWLRWGSLYLLPVSIGLVFLAWILASRFGHFPSFMLPSPAQVWDRFLRSLQDGQLLYHALYTLAEVLLGLAIGLITASSLGYLLAKSRLVERILSPYIVASQAIPIVAIAPLIVIWFGPGILSKVMICALIVFFPVLINTIVGLRSVPEELHELMRSLQATRWQTLSMLELPAALPVILGGLRIGATLAVIGAVVGEFVGADRGLGFLVNVGRSQYDFPLVYVAVFSLILMAMILYGLVVLLEARLLSWQQRPEEYYKVNLPEPK
jgi:ABC-type nitrate/sulfonate/bicarbonate transport system permease component